MSKEYDEYLRGHINAVGKAARWMATHMGAAKDIGDGEYPAEWRINRLMTGQKGYRVACPYCLDMTAMYSTREAAAEEWNEWKTGEAE